MITLPLAKISEARDATLDEKKFTWTHQTQDLVLVFDNYGHGSSSQLLKIVQGTHVRHLVEIERLIQEGKDLTRTLREHGAEIQREKLPISALVRCPLLALSWHLPDKKIRRLQLKFQRNSDYDIAYNHLSQLGLQMEPTNGGQCRSSKQSAKPSSALPSSAQISSENPYERAAPTAGPSCPPSRLAEILTRPYTALTTPTSNESQLQESGHNRPASAYTGYASNAPSSSAMFSDPLKPPEYFTRPGASAFNIRDTSASVLLPCDQPLATAEIDHSRSNDRPETALLFGHPDTAEAALPPRRELPFPRSSVPRSAGSDSSRPLSRPSTSMMGPPPLPARVTSLRPSSARAATQDLELPPLPRPTIVDSAQQQPSWMQQPPRTPCQDQTTPPSGQPIHVYEEQEQRSSSSSSNFSPLSYKRASSSMLPTTRPLSGLSSTAQNRLRSESQSPISTPPTSEIHRQIGVQAEKVGVSDAGANESLAAYAMQSDEERRAALNEFIFRQLDNDNFITLLEDMETAWARVALGMK